MANNVPPSENRLEMLLAAMMVGVLVASVFSILAIIGLAATGQNQAIAIVVVFPMIGLPAAAVFLPALVITRVINNRK